MDAGRLAAVHATGLTTANRSHFSAMEEVEEAAPGSNARVGWLNRLVGTHSTGSPLQGVGLVDGVPPTELSGPVPLMTIGSLDDASIAADDPNDAAHAAPSFAPHAVGPRPQRDGHGRPGDAPGDPGHRPGGPGDRQQRRLRRARASARRCAAAARIIRGNVGTEVITVDQGDWDMHVNLGNLASGDMIGNAQALGTAIAAFFGDLGTQADKVTLVTISEFGRRVLENGNRGLDHGWGNVMFVAGAGVVGNKVYVNKQQGWKPLADDLESDLHVTTDYRHVLSEIVAARFPGAPKTKVFPGLGSYAPLGFMA